MGRSATGKYILYEKLIIFEVLRTPKSDSKYGLISFLEPKDLF